MSGACINAMKKGVASLLRNKSQLHVINFALANIQLGILLIFRRQVGNYWMPYVPITVGAKCYCFTING